jgi:hypothetical protein
LSFLLRFIGLWLCQAKRFFFASVFGFAKHALRLGRFGFIAGGKERQRFGFFRFGSVVLVLLRLLSTIVDIAGRSLRLR